MNALPRAPRASLLLALAALAPPATRAAAAPSSAELARCAAVASAAERLACYDGLTCAGIATAEERLACYDAISKGKAAPSPGSAPAPRAAAAPVPRVPAPAASDPADFGIVKRAPPPKAEVVQQIKAVVTTAELDPQGNWSLGLNNGQWWTFKNGEARVQIGDAVSIRRAALGSFLMTTASHHTYRVQRVK
jgi:hypothetical protein